MGARILIIEDNRENLELMTYLLSAFGHTVVAAEDGICGLEAAIRETPDLVVCDLQLPDIDGFEVARQLRSTSASTSSIPLVAVTALAMVGDRDRVLTAGFDAYLTKPIDPETFVQEIESHLHLSVRLRAALLAPPRRRIDEDSHKGATFHDSCCRQPGNQPIPGHEYSHAFRFQSADRKRCV